VSDQSERPDLNVSSTDLLPLHDESVRLEQRETTGRWWLAVVGLATVLGGITMILVLGWLNAQPSAEAAGSAPAAAPATPKVIVESAPAPKWVGRRQAAWARDGSKTIAFELQAANEVALWMQRSRPLLVVRCVSRATEVFVAIGSAASIEAQAGSHTVRIKIDDDPELVQQWSDSESGQELFAPDGVALARRLADAQQMQFSFTPYNAGAATASFAVQGAGELVGLVAKTCGWRLDGAAPPASRAARRN
jgi:hypothetical protein